MRWLEFYLYFYPSHGLFTPKLKKLALFVCFSPIIVSGRTFSMSSNFRVNFDSFPEKKIFGDSIYWNSETWETEYLLVSLMWNLLFPSPLCQYEKSCKFCHWIKKSNDNITPNWNSKKIINARVDGCHACFMKKTQTEMPEQKPWCSRSHLMWRPTHNAKLWKIHSALFYLTFKLYPYYSSIIYAKSQYPHPVVKRSLIKQIWHFSISVLWSIGQLWLSCSLANRIRSHWILEFGMNCFPHSYFLLLHNCALKNSALWLSWWWTHMLIN